MEIRIALIKGKKVELVILNESYQLVEVVEVTGPDRPLPVDPRSVRISGQDRGHLMLRFEGQARPIYFLQASSLQRPGESVVDLSLRLGTGTEFKVV